MNYKQLIIISRAPVEPRYLDLAILEKVGVVGIINVVPQSQLVAISFCA